MGHAAQGADEVVNQMCTCGAKFQAATISAVWALLEAHVEQVHGRTFPRGSISINWQHGTPKAPRKGNKSGGAG